MLYEENQQLGFAANKYDEREDGNDIMFAFQGENPNQQYTEDDTNFFVYQQDQEMPFPGNQKATMPTQLAFKNNRENEGFGLPDYFGDPKPIEIDGSKKVKKRSTSRKKGQLTMTAGPKFKLNNQKGGIPKKIQPTIDKEKAAKGWNNTNVPDAKYFDKELDKDYLKKKKNSFAGRS